MNVPAEIPTVARRARQAITLLRRPTDAIAARSIFARARARAHASQMSGQTIKYVGDYLSLALAPSERLGAIERHYAFLEKNAPTVSIRDGLTLWQSVDDEGRTHDVILQSSWMAPMEGEAELCFRLGGERLFTLTFSIMDGSLFGCGDAPVAFIGGIQGAYSGRDRIRYTARKNGEIAPTMMLLLGINAVADIFGIATIVGISNASQVARFKLVDGRSSTTDYDALWQRSHGLPDGRGHFLIPVGTSTAVEDNIAGTHKARTRRRRKKRIEIRTAMVGNVASALGIAHPICRAGASPASDVIADRSDVDARATESQTTDYAHA